MPYVNPVSNYNKPLCKGLPGSTMDVQSTDIGRFIFKSSNNYVYAVGGSSFSTSLIAGYVAAVPTASSAGSTIPFYFRKLDPNIELEISYASTSFSSTAMATTYGGGDPATTDIGKYIGFTTHATVAGARMDITNAGNEPGTSNGRFIQITGFSTNRGKIKGFPVVNSSCIAW